jgi:hypothetical protein
MLKVGAQGEALDRVVVHGLQAVVVQLIKDLTAVTDLMQHQVMAQEAAVEQGNLVTLEQMLQTA